MIYIKVPSTKKKVEFYKMQDKVRRFFSSKSKTESNATSYSDAYFLYLEFLSHSSTSDTNNFKPTRQFLMNQLGWKWDKTYTRALNVLKLEGYAHQSGENRNQTTTIYEEASPRIKELRLKELEYKAEENTKDEEVVPRTDMPKVYAKPEKVVPLEK